MITLEEIRSKYPGAASLSDDELIGVTAERYGTTPDIFREAIGYKPPQGPEGGFMASVKQTIGAGIKGAGRAASDFIPGVESDNALTQYGQEVIDANPTAVRSFGDIGRRPGTAVAEATGNAAGSMAGIVGSRALGMGITAAAPMTGPLAPATALLGQAIAWFGPAAMAALPSYGGIRDKQILNDPNNEADWKSKAIAGLGAATVGAIETKFGPQQWALSALTKEGRAALAEKFAETTLAKGIGFGALKGAAVEGAEELAQNPVEQLAGYDDPTTKESLADTAFGGAMGAIGGGVFGGATGGIIGRRGEKGVEPKVDTPADPLLLGNTPDPIVVFPDGTAGRRADGRRLARGVVRALAAGDERASSCHAGAEQRQRRPSLRAEPRGHGPSRDAGSRAWLLRPALGDALDRDRWACGGAAAVGLRQERLPAELHGEQWLLQRGDRGSAVPRRRLLLLLPQERSLLRPTLPGRRRASRRRSDQGARLARRSGARRVAHRTQARRAGAGGPGSGLAAGCAAGARLDRLLRALRDGPLGARGPRRPGARGRRGHAR